LEQSLSTQATAAGFTYFLEAVGKENGLVVLDVNQDSVLTRSNPDPRGTVPQIAFRTAVRRLGDSVGLVKLDCEGAEWGLLADADIWRRVDSLAMEYHLWSGHTDQEARAVVQGLGFRVVRQQPLLGSGILWARR
jgi:FkbM family methyltransferase